MTDRGHGREAKGGKPVGRRVRLPRGAERPIRVFINGSLQEEGTDYSIAAGTIAFSEPILKEDLASLGLVRKAVLGLGLVGSYQRDETVDVEYRLNGRTELASDLKVLPD